MPQTRRLDAEGNVVCRLPPTAPASANASASPAKPVAVSQTPWLAQLIAAADSSAPAP